MKVIIDTREQQPWHFDNTERRTLETGDYTTESIMQYEKETSKKLLRIERKASTLEIAQNLGSDFKRFEKCIQRLSEYDRAILIVEFSFNELVRFPKRQRVYVPKRVRMRGGFMKKQMEYLQNAYGIEIIYTKNKEEANDVAYNILKEYDESITLK